MEGLVPAASGPVFLATAEGYGEGVLRRPAGHGDPWVTASGCQNQKARSAFLRKTNHLLAVRYHISTPLESTCPAQSPPVSLS